MSTDFGELLLLDPATHNTDEPENFNTYPSPTRAHLAPLPETVWPRRRQAFPWFLGQNRVRTAEMTKPAFPA